MHLLVGQVVDGELVVKLLRVAWFGLISTLIGWSRIAARTHSDSLAAKSIMPEGSDISGPFHVQLPVVERR